MSDHKPLSRRTLLVGAAATAAALIVPAMAKQIQQPVGVKPPALSLDLVKEFVIAGHVDLDKVKQMLGNERGLLNATWDWGGGDFEMAIGGAGHMGRRDIALYLVGEGCRMDIFVAAMLGELEVVKTTLAQFPNLLSSHGPHGIPLMAHARAGGEQAKAVLEYLQSLKSE
jgi:hypothetical protein